MTDVIVHDGDRVFVFGNTNMLEYRFNTDVKGLEQLELYKVWQADFADDNLRDKIHQDMKDKDK